MKKYFKYLSLFVASSLLAVMLASCSGESESKNDSTDGNNGGDTASQTTVLDLPEASAVEIDENAPSGTVKWLGYYDLEKDQPDHTGWFGNEYGGEIESEICGNDAAYFEALAVRVSSDLSPDLVRYEWMSYPHGISKNLYMPLDTYLDMDDPLWESVRTTIDRFEYANKHYYYPQRVSYSFALNYNKNAVEFEGFDDPMDMYLAGNWDWNAFKKIISDWCDIDEGYIGYTGVGGMSFTATTGVKVIDVTKDGQIFNNMKDLNIQRCMEFLEGLYKESLVGEGYVSPEEAFVDGKLLFLGLEPTWTYGAAQEALTKAGIDNELAVIPFPRDPNSDVYSIAYDTYGYMIPSGATNVKGALDWIICGRTHEVDPDEIAAAKADAISTDPTYYARCSECKYTFTEEEKSLSVCPECNTARKEKFKVVYTEEQWDILESFKDSTKFNLIFDDVYGFGKDLTNLFNGFNENGSILDGPLFNGDSYTQMREGYFETVEGMLQPYRDKLALDMTQ